MFVLLVSISVTFSDGRGRASATTDEMTLTLGGAHVGVVNRLLFFLLYKVGFLLVPQPLYFQISGG